MISTVNEVIKLNNESVLRLKEGNDQMAVDLLSKCVALMRTNLVCSGRQEKQSMSSSSTGTAGSANNIPAASQSRAWNGENSCPAPSGNYLLQAPKSEKSHQLERYRDKNITHHESFQIQPLNKREGEDCYIFNHMLLFAPQAEVEEDTFLSARSTTADEQCTVRVQSSIVLFNLALIYHLRGRLGNLHSLTTAFKLYKMASQLLTEDNCVLTNETAAVVKLGAVNNMFQILHEQGNRESALNILQFLSSLMRGACANFDSLLLLDRHDYHGFMTNVLLLHPPKFAPAA